MATALKLAMKTNKNSSRENTQQESIIVDNASSNNKNSSWYCYLLISDSFEEK